MGSDAKPRAVTAKRRWLAAWRRPEKTLGVEKAYSHQRRLTRRFDDSWNATPMNLVEENDCEPENNEGGGKRRDFHFLPVHPKLRCGSRGRLGAKSVVVCLNLGVKSEEKHHQARGQQQGPPDGGMFDQAPHRNEMIHL